jgi:3-oxoacyl-[acyl-carrier protein] reductase
VGRFDGAGVIVTGGSSGIGAASAVAFAAEGARVVAVARSRERLERVRDAARNGAVEPLVADLGTADGARHAVATAVDMLGTVEVLVNNAGIADERGVLDITEDLWRRTLAVNLDAPFFASQVVGRHMVERGRGAIVNVASTDALAAEAPMAAYNVSKAGLVMLTRSFALELGHLGVRCNAVAPGQTLTPMTEVEASDPVFRRWYLGQIPLQRFSSAEEQAQPILFLASSEASYVNGATLVVDGGQLAGTWYSPSDRPDLPEDEAGDTPGDDKQEEA